MLKVRSSPCTFRPKRPTKTPPLSRLLCVSGWRDNPLGKPRLKLLCQLQSPHGACRAGEFVGFEAHSLEHADEEVGEGVVAFGIEGEVAGVFEAAAGEEDGHVGGDVGGGVSEVGAVEDHGAAQEGVAVFLDVFHGVEHVGEEFHVPFIDGLELLELFLVFAVVGEVVVAISDFGVFDVEGGGVDAIEHEGDAAGRVAFEGEAGHVVHELCFGHVLGG